MDRRTGLAQLTARLQDASMRRDWDLLERAVRELGPQVQALAARGPWSAAERTALVQLRAAHDGAVRASSEAAVGLAARLADMRDNKEGWMAYALAGEPEPGDTPR